MSRTIYALLVGINEYLGTVGSLNGCVNDVKRMCEFLELRTEGGDFELKPMILTSGDRDNDNEVKPTRKAVIEGFRDHLCKAGSNDVALFYYSGHGSQEKTPPELSHLEPDGLDETIVCYDSRTEDGWDLADKELGLLIAEVAQKDPHILVILDACHSGSGTRAPQEAGVRLAPSDKRERPLNSFEGIDKLQQQKAVKLDDRTEGDWLFLPEGKHVVLSACRPEEVANETFLGDDIHGVMSYYLLDTLQRAEARLTYRDLFARVGTLVRNRYSQQNPVIEASELTQLQEPFLGGAVKPQPPYFSLTYDSEKAWVIGGGAVNGIPAPVDGETTTLAVFDLTTDLAAVETMEDALGWAKVTDVGSGESRVEFTLKSGEKPSHKDTFRAIVVGQPLPPVLVWMEGDEAGLELVRGALKTAGVDKGPSLIVREPTSKDLGAAAERTAREVAAKILAPLTLIARDGRYLISRTDDAYPLMVPVELGYKVAAARLAVARLEHVARWLQVAQIDNKDSKLPPDAVTMEFYEVKDDGSLGERLDTTGGTIRMEYRQQGTKWRRPCFKLKLTNNSDRRLYCALLDLEETFAISTIGLPGGGAWLEPKGHAGSEIWTNQGKPLYLGIEPSLREQGVVSLRDIMKVIASTTEVPAALLEREELGVATRSVGSSRAPVPKSSLARLYSRVQTRGVYEESSDEEVTDWITTQVTLTTVRPRDGADVPAEGDQVSLSDVVTLDGHAGLRARSRLTTFTEGTRDAGNLALPPVFRQHPELGSPFQFSDYRDGAPGLSVLELDVEGQSYREVTPENPLVIHVAKPVADDEYILPLAFDPGTGLHLPLGVCERHENSTTIRIERLPEPMRTRDLKGSIKLFFQKVVAEKLGIGDGETARLAVARVLDGGQVEYDARVVELQGRVAAADRILLYIHGFTGDTRGLVASSKGLLQQMDDPLPTLADQYDLILAFDYESINTPIEETALKLKERLATIGLDGKDKKTLDIVAHSLGTMVTRWFIEREGGNKIVHKAILVGPPNAGTPWAKLEDWAIVGLGAAINGLASIIWPPAAIPAFVGVIGSLVAAVEKVDTTLDELKPGSKFYTLLNASEDPKVPYVVIAGNTKMILPAGSPGEAAERTRMEKLVEQLASKPTRTRIADLVFFGAPNDTSISVKSMVGLPAGWQFAPEVIACDHVSYFTTEVGLRTLAKALP